jgi:predicted Rossmann fold flavoprotein
MVYDLIVVGGGAAGFFGALQLAEQVTDARILIVEKSPKLLAKVKISGGGRCNVTHRCFGAKQLSKHYPRGEKPLRQMFQRYQVQDVVEWFERRGVKLKTEDDGRMFPVTDDSRTIIDCFMNEAIIKKIKIEMGAGVVGFVKKENKFEVTLSDKTIRTARTLLVTIGGSPHARSYDWIKDAGHNIIQPIPSLFTFNDSQNQFKDLMGVSVTEGEVRIEGTKLSAIGPILITHWGLSGPAVIRLSAWAAEHLHSLNYNFNVLINWIGTIGEEELRNELKQQQTKNGKRKIKANPLYNLPSRLWERLCELAEIPEEKIWAELKHKNLNRLLELLIRCCFQIKGKTTFKEEFVTCGGVDLTEVYTETMQSKIVPGMFFAGEVLNIDGETGGFNFQAAWSTAHIAAVGVLEALKKEIRPFEA